MTDSPFIQKQNNIQKLSNLLLLQHPRIVGFRNIFVENSQVTLISEYINAPRLLPFICKQKRYLSENHIAMIAKQLYEILWYARSKGISHRQFDADCIFVTDFNHDKNIIQIKIDGFERYYFERLQQGMM